MAQNPSPFRFLRASKSLKVFWGLSWCNFHRPALEAPSASHPRLEAFHRPQPGSHAGFGGGQNSHITGSETPS